MNGIAVTDVKRRARPRLWLLALLVAVGAACAVYFLFPADWGRWIENLPGRAGAAQATPTMLPTATAESPEIPPAAAGRGAPPPVVEIGIAYGTEKRDWLEAAVRKWGETSEGRDIRVTLIPMGSIEGAHAVLQGDKRINVWSPASAMYRRSFEEEWRGKYGNDPVVSEESLALTPMVFVMWKERYEAFVQKYDRVSFRTVGEAMRVPGGWGAIAGRPEWGLFKFGYTHPNQSNSGLMTLILIANDFFDKTDNLKIRDIMQPDFQQWLGLYASGASRLSNSTGNLMRDMVRKGPSTYDCLAVYESVVIDYLRSAEDRWQPLHVVYPRINVWNDNPYYVLNVPWSTPAQREAAETFLRFLMSEPMQKLSLEHGFRPGDPKVAMRFPDSPFVKFEQYGLKVEVESICENPSPEVINNLQQSWLRAAEIRGL